VYARDVGTTTLARLADAAQLLGLVRTLWITTLMIGR
jgi:hypothetical protein